MMISIILRLYSQSRWLLRFEIAVVVSANIVFSGESDGGAGEKLGGIGLMQLQFRKLEGVATVLRCRRLFLDHGVETAAFDRIQRILVILLGEQAGVSEQWRHCADCVLKIRSRLIVAIFVNKVGLTIGVVVIVF